MAYLHRTIAGGHSLNMGSLRQELHILPPHYPPQDDDEDDWGMDDDVMMMGSTPKVSAAFLDLLTPRSYTF